TALVALDVAYTGFDPMLGKLVGIALAVEPERGCYIPLEHQYAGMPTQLSLEATLARLKPWIESEQHKKVGHQLKLVSHLLANHALHLRGIAHDTMLQSYVLEPHRNHEIENLAERHLGRKTLTLEAVCGKGAGRIEFDAVSVERATLYAAEEADVVQSLQ